MNYLISIIFAVFSALLSFLVTDQQTADKLPLLNSLGYQKERESLALSKTLRIVAAVLIFILTGVSIYFLLRQVTDIVNILRMLSVYIPLTCAGCVDLREKRIPNIFPLVLFILGLVFLLIEYLTNRDIFMDYLASCGIAFLGPLVLLSIVGMVTGKGIGAGDIKLISTLGLIGGVYTLGGTLIFAAVGCSAAALYLLIFKKKNLKSSLPFGPFIAVGYLITVIIGIY